MRGILGGAFAAIVAAAALPVAAAAAVPVNDLAIVRVTNPSAHRIGTLVRVTIVARNEGPDAASTLAVTVFDSSTLQFVSETCSDGVSPDTPSCEYSNVPAGETRRTRVTFLIVGSVDGVASTTACVSSLEANPDPNLDNNCVAITLAVH